MTAATSTATVDDDRTAARAPLRRPSLTRLTGVELRKLADTRAGYWLLITIGLAAAGIAAVQLFVGGAEDQTFASFFLASMIPINVLLPVLGILSVTSEWSQRTSLTTFALVPVRWRVLAAKLSAGIIAALASVLASLAVATAGTAAASLLGDGGRWSFQAPLVLTAAVFQIVNVVLGIGFGMLLLNTPLAIVGYLVLPTAWAILGGMIKALNSAAGWLDLGMTTEPLLTAHVSAGQWARLGVAVLVWVVAPVAGGLVRVTRREIS